MGENRNLYVQIQTYLFQYFFKLMAKFKKLVHFSELKRFRSIPKDLHFHPLRKIYA
jgi:hypothetical protein